MGICHKCTSQLLYLSLNDTPKSSKVLLVDSLQIEVKVEYVYIYSKWELLHYKNTYLLSMWGFVKLVKFAEMKIYSKCSFIFTLHFLKQLPLSLYVIPEASGPLKHVPQQIFDITIFFRPIFFILYLIWYCYF